MRNIGLFRLVRSPMRTLVTTLVTVMVLAVGAAVAWAEPVSTNSSTSAPVMDAIEITPAILSVNAETVAAASVLTAADIRTRQIRLARTPMGARLVARALIAQKYKWNARQFTCLNSLWTKESNWRYRAQNKRTGAYGIPQAYPGSRMALIAKDWRTNPVTQMQWGLRYIDGRYGTPCAAWAKFKRSNWY